jgi:hypothetical protein
MGSWPAGQPRRSKMVLIGRNLDEAVLRLIWRTETA